MSYKTPLSLLLAVVLLTLLSQVFFVVPQGATGVTVRMQRPLELGLAPGVHFKLPFVDDVVTLDAGGIALDSDLLNGGRLKFQSADGRTLETGYFALWRIDDLQLFCRSVGCDEGAAAHKLNDLIVPRLHDTFAFQNSTVLLASQIRIADGLAPKLDAATARFGVHLERVQLSGINLGANASEEIYSRMRSAETARAAEVRAAGAAQAAKVRSEADVERLKLLAAADAEAKRIRAEGEARAAEISASAARQDPEFFAFFQSLAAYRRSLAGCTVMVLDQDRNNPFLKYLKTPNH